MGKNYDYDYDYIIIGSGPAGRTAGVNLARAGKAVAIIEAEEFGGAEINTRDLPYKLALEFSHNYRKFVTSPAVASVPHFNLPTLTAAREQVIAGARNKVISELQGAGIRLISGFAHFLDQHTVAVDTERITAKYFILATGAELKATEISGLETVKYFTPDNALNLRKLPSFVFVAGGGPTGVQAAEYFAELGTGVILMERGTHILPREDEDVSGVVTRHLAEDLGVLVMTGARVVALTEDRTSKIVVFSAGAGEKMVRVDAIVLATGAQPFLDYGLENAGVEYKHTGINVDKYFNTSAKNIFAIGDAVGTLDSSTERATYQAEVLVNNLLHRQKITPKYNNIPRIIKLSTAVATVGLNERDALSRDLRCKKTIKSLSNYDDKGGFVKTLMDASGKFLGATVVAPGADEAIKLRKLI